ncbi:MAG: N-acetyl-gamma-glutamyl-phosphate reductase [Rhodospirillales bacterium]|nr:N-acetyl-gamma-glutamyl-phosphate reductase [Rhodospirillales bacterium]
MSAKIFIDGEVGTTGLQIRARLDARGDVTVISLAEQQRKDPTARADMLNTADLAILCLPDDAARDAVAMIENPEVRVIDASTAHRTNPDWTYGFPELNAAQPAAIAASKRVTNPGCYALSSVAMIHPLVAAGLLPADYPVTINAVSGYSGGGRKMIESFEDKGAPDYTDEAFRVYGLSLAHKHVPEIQTRSGLSHRPLFMPSVGRFHQGMIVQLPLPLWALPGAPTAEDLHTALADHYRGQPLVIVAALEESSQMTGIQPEAANGTDELHLYVFANTTGGENEGQAVVMALLDNLGKGASGQAVQNMNLMLGLEG